MDANLKSKDKKRLLFVCLGNICRSPAAEGIMQSLVDSSGLSEKYSLDSAGLYGGHAGERPDQRMRVHATRRGYDLIHRSRKVKESDFNDFDLIIAMDDSNYSGLMALAPTREDQKKVVRMRDFLKSFPGYDHVPDPYYEGAEGFELVIDMLEEGCRNLLETLEN